MQYGELPLYGGADISNGRAVVQSTDAGMHWTDMTGDATPQPAVVLHPYEDMHPDQHAIVVRPGQPGHLVRRLRRRRDPVGRQVQEQHRATAPSDVRGLTEPGLRELQAAPEHHPEEADHAERRARTLQFQSLSVDPNNPLGIAARRHAGQRHARLHGSHTWFLGITGDGGDSGIDADNGNIRFHSYTAHDPTRTSTVRTRRRGCGPATRWCFSRRVAPLLRADDRRTRGHRGTIFAGMDHVWRTNDNGGDQTFLEAHCNTTGCSARAICCSPATAVTGRRSARRAEQHRPTARTRVPDERFGELHRPSLRRIRRRARCGRRPAAAVSSSRRTRRGGPG